MEKVLYGKPVAHLVTEQIRVMLSGAIPIPSMAVIKVGHDPASEYYFNNIARQAGKLGIQVKLLENFQTVTTRELLLTIEQLNIDPAIHGIIIQKPLPGQIDEELISNKIDPNKDIDGINPINLGRLFISQKCFVPCTAAAVIEIIRYYGIETRGKHVVILGRSPVVAKPLAGLFLQKTETGNATVTICHSLTQNLPIITQNADILVAAIGKANFVQSGMIRPGAICLDVGINLIQDLNAGESYVGDIDYFSCLSKAGAISPVPGGIGSVTTSILLRNLCVAALDQHGQ
jgi:methylenetetrahydrofolate dehydrogenase (NADP+) / methenyltetrahydrofolate cyclohydrolase